jgi:hypothetical protein
MFGLLDLFSHSCCESRRGKGMGATISLYVVCALDFLKYCMQKTQMTRRDGLLSSTSFSMMEHKKIHLFVLF